MPRLRARAAASVRLPGDEYRLGIATPSTRSRPERRGRQARGDRRVDAARQSEDDAREAALARVVAQPEHERAVRRLLVGLTDVAQHGRRRGRRRPPGRHRRRSPRRNPAPARSPRRPGRCRSNARRTPARRCRRPGSRRRNSRPCLRASWRIISRRSVGLAELERTGRDVDRADRRPASARSQIGSRW